MKGRVRLGVAAIAALAMLAGACGGGRDGSGATSSDDTSPTETTGAAAFGTLESPCGEGDARGATDQGVTDTSITIGYGDDAGFASSPGLNHQMADGVKAFIDWCNDQGGILGREVVGDYHDAKLLDVNNAMIEACQKDFMLVGQGWTLDSAQETTRRGCGLPSVAGFAVSPQHAMGPDVWYGNNLPSDYYITSAAYQLAELFPEEIKKSAVMWGNYAATQDTKERVLSTYPQAGYTFLDCGVEYNISGEADWKPLVQRLKDCGAEHVYFIGSPYPNFENLLTAANQLGYDPVWTVTGNAYDEAFRDWNVDGLADRTYMGIYNIPFEEAGSDEATQQYLDIVRDSGGDVSQLGELAVSSFLLWATAAKACGSDLTRECMRTQLDSITEWDSGGFQGTSNPGERLPAECGILLKMNGTSFERVSPSEPGTFDCDPRYAAKVTGPFIERANLDENRVSQLG